MTLNELKQIAEANGELDGWDFSRIRAERTPTPWKYTEVVRRYLKPTDHVLDIGTGGGEVFLSLAPYFDKGVAVDQQSKMIEAAKRNISILSIDNVSLHQMDADNLKFEAETFDVVLTKHLRVFPDEILRVLRPGGYFITQQVEQRTSSKLLAAFDWTPASFGPNWWQPATELADEFRARGCHIIAEAEYDVPYWFQDIESLLFFLMAVPWPEKIELEKHWQNINHILDAQTERGIESNEHRGLLIVRKPDTNS